MNRKILKKVVAFLLAFLCVMPLGTVPAHHAKAAGTTYYVDSAMADDSGSGTSPSTAWKSLDKVNSTTFAPGDQILFKKGDIWNGQLHPLGSGSAGNPIVIDSFGSGNQPIINGNGLTANTDLTGGAAVYLYNQEYWEIRDLEVTNTGATAALRFGVSVVADDYGTAHYIHLIGLTVHDVNGSNTDKKNGGIAILALGTTTTTKWDDVLIDGNTVYHVDRTGINTHSVWMTRGGMTGSGPWNPWTNVVVQNNQVSDTGGDGILVRVAQSPIIQYNVDHDASARSGDFNVGIWPFNTDDAIVQYNESYLTRTTKDGEGFDVDYDTNRTILQYNYSHDNEGGFALICSDGSTNFNNDTVVRYNISQNDLARVIRVEGTVKNASIYNNTLYVKSGSTADILHYDNWGGYPDGTSFRNNIVDNNGSGGYSFTSSTNNIFDYNVFYGNHPSTEPADPHKLTSDPLFINPGTGALGRHSVDGYMLRQGSPAIDSGMTITGNGGRDYWGNSVPYNSATDRGAYEGPGIEAVRLFSDNFEDGSSDGWTTSSGTWNVVPDTTQVYTQSSTSGEAIALAGTNWTDYAYSASVKLDNAKANAGLIYRAADSNNFYMFRLNNNSGNAELYKKVSGGLTLIESVPYPTTIGQWYALKIQVNGNQMTGWVNGVQELRYTDPVVELATGKIGFRTSGSTASFDNVVVTEPLFADNFEDGNANGWTVSSGIWSVSLDNGNEVYSQSNSSGEAIASAGNRWTDYTYSARIRLNNTSANGGILFRVADNNNFYMFRLNNYTGNVELYKRTNGTLTLLASTPFASTVGQWYTLLVTTSGNQMTGYVDGTQMITWSNPVNELSAGYIGVRDSGSTLSVDDVLVTE